MDKILRSFLYTIVLMGMLLLLPGSGVADEREAFGKQLYLKYCSACHGPSAKGDGVVSHLMTPRPTDLTELAIKSDGNFPFFKVLRAIDGRTTMRAHGDPDMPVWGELFTMEEGDSPDRHAQARGKVLMITEYLASIQAK